MNKKTITDALVVIFLLSIANAFGPLAAKGQTASGINISFSPNPAPNSPILITAYVYGNNPTGNITWSTTSNTGVFSSTSTPLDNKTFSATTTYTDTTAGVVTIGASYSGDSNNYPCAEYTLLVMYSSTYRISPSVSISCSHDISVANSPVVCTVTVSGYYPTGIIEWSSNSSAGVFSSNSTVLSDFSMLDGSSSTTFTDSNPGTVAINASYSGDSRNLPNTGTTVLTLVNANSVANLSVLESGTKNSVILVSVGSQFNVDIRIDNATNVWGYFLELDWDPSVLRLINVTEGPFLKQVGSTLFIVGSIDNTSGNIQGGIADVLFSTNVANGSGVLATLSFQAIGVGNSNITINSIQSQIVENSGDLQLPFSVNDGVVSSSSPIDFFHDGTVNFQDIVYFVCAYIQYYQTGYLNPACDLNHDGTLNFQDIVLFIQDYIAYGQSLATDNT